MRISISHCVLRRVFNEICAPCPCRSLAYFQQQQFGCLESDQTKKRSEDNQRQCEMGDGKSPLRGTER